MTRWRCLLLPTAAVGAVAFYPHVVIPGLDPGIHAGTVFRPATKKARITPGLFTFACRGSDQRFSTESAPGPETESARKPPAMAKFLKKLLNSFMSAQLV